MTETAHKVRLLVVARVVIVTTLLLAAFLVELVFHTARSLEPLTYLSALAVAAYALTVLYGLLERPLRGRAGFVWAQLAGDVALCTGFVYLTGGVASPFSFLYVPVIVAGAILLFRRGAVWTAALSCLAYGSLVVLMVYGTLPAYPPGSFVVTPAEITRASLSLLGHFLGFGLVALLASALSESLRRTGQELGEARDSLEDLQAFNALIIDSINAGLLTTDAGGRITFINRGGREITGLTEEAAVDRSLVQVFGLGSEFLPELREALLRQRRHRFETAFAVSRDVIRILGFTAGVLRDRTDVPIGYILTFQDLTDIKALEREVLLRERMAAVGEMAAGMAHELRNPLGAISGSVQELARTTARNGAGRGALLDIIRREALRLDQVLTDFLAFARPRPFAPEPADLVTLLADLVRLLRNSPDFAPCHEVVTEFSATSIPCQVDVNQMKQVFWNLAINALRAMPGGGRLTVTAGPGPGGQVNLAFADTGRGMSAAEVRDFFRPFRSRFDAGTGLGNAIVYRIVEDHGGRIHVDSAPGRGTTVRITVPAPPASPAGITAPEAAWPPKHRHVS